MIFEFKTFSYLFFLFSLLIFTPNAVSQDLKVEFERVREKCSGIPFEDRVRVSVTRFNTTTIKARGQFGEELATMLENALSQVNCFRVLESNLEDLTEEQRIGQMGFTQSGSSPQSGQMLGAQAVLTGEVTEFAEGEGKAGMLGVTLSNDKAKIGFIMKVLNPATREVLWSRSVEAEARKPGGFKGVKVGGLKLAGGNKQNTAINDAMERAIIQAVQQLADDREKIPFPNPKDGLELDLPQLSRQL